MADYVEGKRPVIEAMRTDVPLKKILMADNAKRDPMIQDILRKAKQRDIPVINVPRDELVHRIHQRAAVSNRSDDTEDVIRHRIEEYDLKTQPVLDYYRVSGLLVSVDGSGEIAETNGRICQVIDARLNR